MTSYLITGLVLVIVLVGIAVTSIGICDYRKIASSDRATIADWGTIVESRGTVGNNLMASRSKNKKEDQRCTVTIEIDSTGYRFNHTFNREHSYCPNYVGNPVPVVYDPSDQNIANMGTKFAYGQAYWLWTIGGLTLLVVAGRSYWAIKGAGYRHIELLSMIALIAIGTTFTINLFSTAQGIHKFNSTSVASTGEVLWVDHSSYKGSTQMNSGRRSVNHSCEIYARVDQTNLGTIIETEQN